MALKTRKPTGAVPWPLVLIEGEEKAGKTWACAEFTASDKVGRCFWIDLGEGAADEYGAIPGADYEIVEHDGSYSALLSNVTEIHGIAAKALANGDKPVVLVIDTMTDEWDILKDWAADRAKSSRTNRAKLAKDPNAEITISQNYWNDANARHRKLMRMLKTFPGIVLMTSHGKQVAVLDANGQPVEGKKQHKVEAQKSLGADASCWIRLFRTEPGVIVGGRSVHLKFRPGEDSKPLASDWTLEGIIFNVLQCDPANAHVRDFTERRPDSTTPEQIAEEALRPATTFARIRELYALAEQSGYDDVTVFNEQRAEELLLHLLKRVGDEKPDAPRRSEAPQGQRGKVSRPAQQQPAASDVEPKADDVPPELQVPEGWTVDHAIEAAAVAPDLDKCRSMWRDATQAGRAGASIADVKRVKDVLTARMDDLKREAEEAQHSVLDPEDPWAVWVEEIATSSDAEQRMNELLEEFKSGRIDETRANTIRNAISARAAKVADVLEGQVAA